MKFITAINALSSPNLAVLVMILGCGYSIIAHKYGLNNDIASGIIGAGIGLLTGQALAKTQTFEGHPPTQTVGPPLAAEPKP